MTVGHQEDDKMDLALSPRKYSDFSIGTSVRTKYEINSM